MTAPTDIERNTAAVGSFFKALKSGNAEGLRAILLPDAVWNVPKSGGIDSPRGADAVVALLTGAPHDFYRPETARFEMGFLVADAKSAALQFRMRCTTARDTPYDNLYVFTFRFDDGRIAEGWEHTDTAYWQSAVRGIGDFA
jgi:ketosteroid isomerase-like protein